jgi:hypothetical protein
MPAVEIGFESVMRRHLMPYIDIFVYDAGPVIERLIRKATLEKRCPRNPQNAPLFLKPGSARSLENAKEAIFASSEAG